MKQKIGNTKKTALITIITCALFFALALLVLCGIMVGSANLRIDTILKTLAKSLPLVGERLEFKVNEFDQMIILQLRLPRIILALLVGAGLSMAGVVFQALFRNPLAEPFVIGTSSGAAFGAALAIVFQINLGLVTLGPFSLNSLPLLAFAGALGTTLLVYRLAKVGGKPRITLLLLAGIAVSTFISSLTSTLMILNKEDLQRIILFTMGGFSTGRWSDVFNILPYVLLTMVFLSSYSRELDILLLGEEKAHQLGVNLEQLQKILVFSASLLVAATVSAGGVIGFVGLVVPHMTRLLVGAEHKVLLPLSALAGGVFLLLADTIARTVIAPVELPVGIITSLMGAPFFLYLLRKKKGLA